MMLRPADTPKYTIKFNGVIDRHYKTGYCSPQHGRFKFFHKVKWTTENFSYAASIVKLYNLDAHRNRREAENIYTIIQLSDIPGISDAHWERTIEVIHNEKS